MFAVPIVPVQSRTYTVPTQESALAWPTWPTIANTQQSASAIVFLWGGGEEHEMPPSMRHWYVMSLSSRFAWSLKLEKSTAVKGASIDLVISAWRPLRRYGWWLKVVDTS